MKKLILLLILLPVFLFPANPKITSKEIIFYYKNSSAHDVKLIGSFDNYKTTFQFMKTRDEGEREDYWILKLDLTFLDFQVPAGRYYYKLIVNNIHTIDPENENYTTDPYTGELSYFDVGQKLIAFSDKPQKIGHLTYRFYYKKNSSEKIEQVSFLGSFNKWQPYQYLLKQADASTYYIDFQFEKPGTYHYQFKVNSERKTDISNTKMVTTKLKEEFSVIEVE
ncbi:MAG TPA: hypothetical protein DHW82_04435 [Spirochaetia bacterium]|nr:MAG: hypothetical protein A2Y41_14350 [Spirochaetes bacterium GWB1_36_13]HCL56241.1 hypothetical protein [Spirochaetia bacterium]